MALKPYLPVTDGGKNTWIINFDETLGGYATKLSLTKPTTDGVHADRLAINYSMAFVTASQAFEFTCVTTKNTLINGMSAGIIEDYAVFVPPGETPPPAAVEPGVFRRISALVKTIKANKNYTQAIGEALGIIGSEPITDSDLADTVKTVLKAKIKGDYINIKYLKGSLTGIILECKRGTELVFTLVDKITEVNYVDRRPNLIPGQPETRVYRAWCVIKGEKVGVVSDTISITVN